MRLSGSSPQQQQQSSSQIVFINTGTISNNLQNSTVSYSIQQQQQHQTLVREPPAYNCKSCSWTGDSEDHLLEHLCSVHLEPGENKGGTGSGNKRPLTTTIRHVASKTSKTAATSRGKLSAKSAKPPGNQIESNTYSPSHRYACQFLKCLKRFRKLDQLRHHHRVHLNLKPFHCSWEGCGVVFSRRPTGLRYVLVLIKLE